LCFIPANQPFDRSSRLRQYLLGSAASLLLQLCASALVCANCAGVYFSHVAMRPALRWQVQWCQVDSINFVSGS